MRKKISGDLKAKVAIEALKGRVFNLMYLCFCLNQLLNYLQTYIGQCIAFKNSTHNRTKIETFGQGCFVLLYLSLIGVVLSVYRLNKSMILFTD